MIKLKNTPDQIELVKAIGDKNPAISRPAAEAYAGAIGPVLQEVLEAAGTVSLAYNPFPFQEDDSPFIPLGLFRGELENYVNVWTSTTIPGGLPTSEIAGVNELKFSTAKFETAVSFPKKYARKHNLNVLSAATQRMLNELLIKRELVGWSVLLRALAEASTNVNGTATNHLVAAGTQGVFKLADLSAMITKARRINSSFNGGTPVTPFSKGITDLFVSPEVKEDIRAFVYNPMNTTAVPNTDESTALGLPDSIREEIYRGIGTSSLFDISITDLNELGVGYKYNTVFSTYVTGTPAPGGVAFNNAVHELALGLDLTKRDSSAFMPIATDNYTGGTVTVQVDDQFPVRSDKQGWWAMQDLGFVIGDARYLMGLIL